MAQRGDFDQFPFLPFEDEFFDEDIFPDEEELELPVLPLLDTVIFPHMVSPLFVGRDFSLKAVEEASNRSHTILLVAQHEAVEEVESDQLYRVGTEAVIGRVLRMPDGSTSMLVQGQRRLQIEDFVQEYPYFRARAKPIYEQAPESEEDRLAAEALVRAALVLFEKVVKFSRNLPDDAYVAALNVDSPGDLADFIASTIQLSVAQRQEILEAIDPVERLQRLSILLAQELDVLELENKIHTEVQKEVDRSQREYFLREQMKAIQRELGQDDPIAQEVNELRERIAERDMPEAVVKKAEEELSRLVIMPLASPEVSVIRTYLDWLIALPWSEMTEDLIDIQQASKVLDDNHYGLPNVKERILEFMAVRKLAPDKMRSPVLCFIGPPGVGKTSLGRSIAEALARKFVRISLGGIHDEAEIRGHRRTYVGALPGRILQAMRTAGTANPVFMMDEIDKIGSDFRGDPAAALLEVLDPELNHEFSDHYLELPYDLSRVLFITTGNLIDPVPPALQDRMEVIEIPGYTEEEKSEIARRFLVPKQLDQNGLQPGQLRFSDEALLQIIRLYTYEAGVRNLERNIGAICRKVARIVAEGRKPPRHIRATSLHRFLGPPRFFYGEMEQEDQVGVSTGVAVTQNGGDTMAIEVNIMEDGKANLLLTGQLGEVMQESAQAALSYTRSNARHLGIDTNLFEQIDIHIHIPEGGVPKDGPSAGLAIAIALISALTKQPIRRDVVMTGEITLRGRILPIGGVKEKALATRRAGMRTFILPKKNEPDLEDVPKSILRDLEIVLVEHVDEVLPLAFPTDSFQDEKQDD
ncbi:MAG: endopeptidase La [Chloroflexia bacterium]|nr:endopeptidase La [Chloroflexia bacterium]